MIKIGIVGTGVMGLELAILFSKQGNKVVIKSMNNNEKQGINKIKDRLNKLMMRGKISIEEKDYILKNISGDLYNCDIKDCDLVIEAVTEDIEIKKEVFSYLDDICNDKTIFATNTSSLSITELAAFTRRADRFIGMHFFNPATVMNLVEIIKALQTSQETFDFVKEVIIKIGKKGVEINESPGFVVNRILIPMINEAVGIYAEGVSTIENIDKAMVLGANHPMGPLALADLIGLDVCLNIMDVLYKETGDSKYRAHNLLRKYVRVGWLGRKMKKGFYDY